MMWKPDFDLYLKALKGGKTSRPVLFDFLMSEHIAEQFAGKPKDDSPLASFQRNSAALAAMGYDYAAVGAPSFHFISNSAHSKESATMDETKMVSDWADLDKYQWLEPDERIPEYLAAAAKLMPEGMKLFVFGPSGVLENASAILGFSGMMINLYENPDLVKAVVDGVGSRLLKYYELALQVRDVGVIMCNDDWGHKTQTMMSPRHMREYIFPWHKKAVAAAHAAGRPAVLHSCGEHRAIMDDIIDDMGYDGKHSYEDTIQPVEQAYDQFGSRICIMGGMDMDFLCRSTPEDVYARARAMLLKSRENGHYMLGTGNSLARYLPLAQYAAMRQAAYDLEKEW
jgi:uroporphyrinogen decarboxylase